MCASNRGGGVQKKPDEDWWALIRARGDGLSRRGCEPARKVPTGKGHRALHLANRKVKVPTYVRFPGYAKGTVLYLHA